MLDDMSWTLLIVLALAALIGGAGWWWLCRALPEPTAQPGQSVTGRTSDEPKTPYRDLATWRWTTLIAVLAATVAGTATGLPHAAWPVWLVMATLGLWQAGLDLATTWIPKTVAHATWAATAIAITTTWTMHPATAITEAVAAAGVTAVFWLVWRIGGGFGFGDVRFAPILAAATSTLLAGAGLLIAIATGCAITATWMLIDRRRSAQHRMIPWTPGLWIAAALTLLASH